MSTCFTLCPPGLLVDNNRLKQAEQIIGAFDELMPSHRGEVSCTVTSAQVPTHYPALHPQLSQSNLLSHSQVLDVASIKSLQGALAGLVKKGQVLKISTKVLFPSFLPNSFTPLH